MPVHLQWDEEDPEMLRVTVVGKWTLEDLVLATDQTQKIIEHVGKPIFIIFDATESYGLPIGNAVPHMQRIFRLNYHHTVLIGGSSLSHILINMILKLNPSLLKKFQIVDTMDEAEDIIRQKRE